MSTWTSSKFSQTLSRDQGITHSPAPLTGPWLLSEYAALVFSAGRSLEVSHSQGIGAPCIGLSHRSCHWPRIQPSQLLSFAQEIPVLVCGLWSVREKTQSRSVSYMTWKAALKATNGIVPYKRTFFLFKRSTSLKLGQPKITLNDAQRNLSPFEYQWFRVNHSDPILFNPQLTGPIPSLPFPYQSQGSYSHTSWVSAYFLACPPRLCNSAPPFPWLRPGTPAACRS